MTERCRHCDAEWEIEGWEYCPHCDRNYGGAVYPATQTPAELQDIDAVVTIIQEAFAGVRLEDGTTIHEADLEGAYSDDQVRLDARAKDREVDWRDVPDSKIENFSSALSFLDPRGWRFYIPAFMCWTLKNWRTTQTLTADSTVWDFEPRMGAWSVKRYETLSDEQGRAVLAFLDFFRRYSGEPAPDRAIVAYWRRFRRSDEEIDGGQNARVLS